jgi:6-phosphogluconolactonase
LQTKDEFSIVLSGGSTPKALYELLASDRFRDKIEWSKTLVFFGDERCVSPDDAESNFRMANESLLSRVAIPAENVFRLRGEVEPEKAAAEYESVIKKNLGDNPRFDLILLGLGDDGHTASLFPGTGALGETEKLAAANFVEKLNASRLTLTFRAVNAAKNILFLVAGAKKAGAVEQILSAGKVDLPAAAVKPVNGKCRWFLDEPAAARL